MQVRFVIRLKSVHRLDQSILGEDLRCLSVFCVVKSRLHSPHTHSLNPLLSWWNISRPVAPATWTLFCAVRFTFRRVSCPTLPFLCASRCAGVFLPFAFPMGSTLRPYWLCIRLVSSACGQSNPKPFVFRTIQEQSLHV